MSKLITKYLFMCPLMSINQFLRIPEKWLNNNIFNGNQKSKFIYIEIIW